MEQLTLDALKLIQETAVKASGAEGKLRIPHPELEPSHIYLAIKPDGTYERIEAQPAPRKHTVDTLDEICSYANVQGTDKTVVWFDVNGVVVVLNDETRRDVAHLKLSHSPQFNALRELAKSDKQFDQKQFRRFLRVTMDGCAGDRALLDFVQSVRWSTSGTTTGQVTHQKSSMGREIEESVIGGVNSSECPEEITFCVKVFDDPGLLDMQFVRCAVEILPTDQRFILIPFPDQIQRAIDAELTNVGMRIREAQEHPTYRGCP